MLSDIWKVTRLGLNCRKGTHFVSHYLLCLQLDCCGFIPEHRTRHLGTPRTLQATTTRHTITEDRRQTVQCSAKYMKVTRLGLNCRKGPHFFSHCLFMPTRGLQNDETTQSRAELVGSLPWIKFQKGR